MKRSLIILVLAIAVVGMQACTQKSKEETKAVPAVVVVEPVAKPTAAERKAAIEKKRIAQEERRASELNSLVVRIPTYTDAKGHIVYNKAELAPTFNGGDKAMMKYLRENLKFPQGALDKELEGTVFVDFVVAANGSVREVSATEATDDEVFTNFKEEAIRVVASMPKWLPGRQHGKAVDVKFSIPISFEMI